MQRSALSLDFLWDHVGHAAVFAYGAAFALAGIIAL
jgi:hypothetical protein